MDELGAPGDGAFSRQLALAALLRRAGDSRYGGTLPIGGKATALGENYMGRPPKAASQAYDHIQNMREQELEDLARRPGGADPRLLQGGYGAYY